MRQNAKSTIWEARRSWTNMANEYADNRTLTLSWASVRQPSTGPCNLHERKSVHSNKIRLLVVLAAFVFGPAYAGGGHGGHGGGHGNGHGGHGNGHGSHGNGNGNGHGGEGGSGDGGGEGGGGSPSPAPSASPTPSSSGVASATGAGEHGSTCTPRLSTIRTGTRGFVSFCK